MHTTLTRALPGPTTQIDRSTFNIIEGNQANTFNYYSNMSLSPIPRKVHAWLSGVIPSANYNGALEARMEHTGLWFINGERFKAWKSEADFFLWVHGTTGCGKTVLSASIIEDVVRHCGTDPSLACGYFFFDGRDGQQYLQQQDGLIRSLILQFCTRLGTYPEPLEELYKKCHDGKAEPTNDSLRDTLLLILDSFEHAYIVIDALDECTERQKLLKWIMAMTSSKKGKVHLLVTSRDEEDIAKLLRRLDPRDVTLEPELDIEYYINVTFETDDAFDGCNEEVKSNIKSTLMQSSDGMFRLVSLQMEELRNYHSPGQWEEQLKRLPKGLDEFYRRTVSGIKDTEDALKILQWLAFSFRPLHILEVAQVVGVVPDNELGLRFDTKRLYPNKRHVLTVCSTLVTITEADYVKLAHMSVKDYLLRNDDGFNIDEKPSQSFIGQSCLAYYMQFDIDTIDLSPDEVKSDFPLADYAARFWSSHIRAGTEECSEVQQKLLSAFFQPNCPPPFRMWLLLDSAHPRYSHPRYSHPIIYASYEGVVQAVQLLFDRGFDATGETGAIALQFACSHGYEATVKLLLEKGADPSMRGHYLNAIEPTCFKEHESIMKLLLEHGATVEAIIKANAPKFVIFRHHKGFMKLFLKHGLDPNAIVAADAIYHLLGFASSRGCLAIVKLLLEYGADINAISNYGGSALGDACYGGYEDIVKLLLQKNADTGGMEAYYGTPICAASLNGFREIVETLIQYGADVNAQGGMYNNALQGASAYKHEAVVKLLLENGANVNAQGGKYGTALQAALAQHNESIAKLLLDNGAVHTIQG